MKLSKKYRKHGLHIFCVKHNKVETKSPCSFDKYHVYQSRIWTGKPWNKFKIKNWSGIIDEKEAFDLHQQFKEDLIAHDFYMGDLKPKKKAFPVMLKDCLNMYLDHMQDIDVPEDERKNLSDTYLKGIERHAQTMLESTGNKSIYLVDKFDKGKFSQAIPGGSSSFNAYMGTMRYFFNWLIKYGYEVENPFDEVKRKRTKKKVVILSNEDLRALFRVITPENGVNKGGRVANWYFDWLPQIIKLSLMTGCRREEAATMKCKDILLKEKVILVTKRKETKKANDGFIDERPVPLTIDLAELIAEIGLGDPEDYLIHAGGINRSSLLAYTSLAFTHFWKQTGIEKPATFHSLRKTYATNMERIQPGVTKYLNLHTNDRTQINHYLSKEAALSDFTEKRLFDLRGV